jgi:hypothetical protein
MSKHNVFVFPGNIDSAYPGTVVNNVQTVVGDRLRKATSEANDLMDEAKSYLSDIKALMKGLKLDELEPLAIDEDIDNIISKLIDHIPSTDELNFAIEAIEAFDVDDEPQGLDKLQEVERVEVTGAKSILDSLIGKWLTKLTQDGTGLDPVVEENIWKSFLFRQQIENERLVREAENYYASKGFTLPPGTLQGKVNELLLAAEATNRDQIRTISIEQAKLAQTNTHFIMQESLNAGIRILADECERIVKFRTTVMEEYTARLDYIRLKVAAYEARCNALAKLLNARTGVFSALAAAASAEIQSKLGVAELKLKERIANMDIKLKEIEYEIERAKQYYGIQIEAARTAANVMSQLCASTLSSVHTQASIGVQAGISNSSSVTVGASWEDSDSYSETVNKNV